MSLDILIDKFLTIGEHNTLKNIQKYSSLMSSQQMWVDLEGINLHKNKSDHPDIDQLDSLNHIFFQL